MSSPQTPPDRAPTPPAKRASALYPVLPIVVVDDELQILQGTEIALKSAGMNHVRLCQDSRQVRGLLEQVDAEVLLLDLTMPCESGEDVLNMLTAEFPDVPVIIFTGTDLLETAVRCMRAGAFDYMVKPVSKERLVSAVRHAVEKRALLRENCSLRDHVMSGTLENPQAFSAFDTRHPRMLALFRYAESIARSPEPVLITGETGVGKEIMARSIHALSGVTGEFVAVNVAGLDENAFSDTLFGHRRGAFTGATEPRRGLIETASGGTLFLDEIGDLPPTLQVKLLRLLQEHEFFPLGSDVAKRTDARLIFATNVALQDLADSHRFRRDFYFRLRRHHIHIPPLRERTEDLPLLVKHIVQTLAERVNTAPPAIPDEVLQLLASHGYPGNIRELEAILADVIGQRPGTRLTRAMFEPWIKTAPTTDSSPSRATSLLPAIGLLDPFPTLKQAQQTLIEEALRRTGGNQSAAATLLGITRQALNRRVNKS